jgi:hypothetical protein
MEADSQVALVDIDLQHIVLRVDQAVPVDHPGNRHGGLM